MTRADLLLPVLRFPGGYQISDVRELEREMPTVRIDLAARTETLRRPVCPSEFRSRRSKSHRSCRGQHIAAYRVQGVSSSRMPAYSAWKGSRLVASFR